MSKKNRNKISDVEAPITSAVDDTSKVEVEKEPIDQTVINIDEPVIESVVSELEKNEEEIKTDFENAVPVHTKKSVISENPIIEEQEPIKSQSAIVEKQPPVVNNQPINKEVLKVEKQHTPITRPTVALTAGVKQFNEIGKKYIELMTSNVITDDIKKRAIITLANMCNFVTMSSDPTVFDACYEFMLKNRAIMLVPGTVIDGINKFLPKNKITKVVQFYVTFQSLVESKLLHTRFTLNIVTVSRALGNEALKNWLITRR